MTVVIFDFGPGDVRRGEMRAETATEARLLDLCDAALAPVPFSCRSATCGTCQVEVLQGAALLAPPNAAERELLAQLGSPAHTRLACQARVRGAEGSVRVRAVGIGERRE